MASYRLTRQARKDLIEIWSYIAQDSIEHADRFIDRLVDRLWLLAENPYSGRSRDDVRGGYRSVPVGDYVVFYRVAKPGIQINHVLHGARDLAKALRQR